MPILYRLMAACLLLGFAVQASAAQDAAWENHMEQAASLHQQGQLEAAERRLVAALEIAEEFEPNDRRLSQTLVGLAIIHFDQDHYDAAEPLLQRALALDEEVLGPDHPFVAHSLSALGLVYLRQSQNDQAEPLFQRALAIYEITDGPTKRYIGQTLANLAGLYFMEGRAADAEPFFQRALPIQEKVLGPRDPALIALLENYATALRLLDRVPEAEALEAKARSYSD